MNIKKTILAVAAILTVGLSVQAAVLVSNNSSGTIGLYDEATGAAINANFITGLGGPYGITHDSSGIFIANINSGVVSKFDLETGAIINTFSLSGVANPTGLAVINNVLYVANATGTIGTYNATTGASIATSLISVGGLVRAVEIYNNQLYVGDVTNSVVKTYGLDGSSINPSFLSFNTPSGFAFSGNTMFVTSADLGLVGEVNATTGSWFNTPVTSGLSSPIGIAIDSDGNLLVANFYGAVSRYTSTGTLLSSSFLAGTDGPIGLDIISVPEPSVVALIAASGMAFIFIRKRRSLR